MIIRNILNRYNETHAFWKIFSCREMGMKDSVELELAFDLAGQFGTDYLREGNQLPIRNPKINMSLTFPFISI
jgi:hypothetical protein